MNLHETRPNLSKLLTTLIVLMGMLAISTFVACGDMHNDALPLQMSTPEPNTTPTFSLSSPTTTPYPPATESKDQFDTRVAQNRAQWATEIALTPTWTPGPPPPTQTPELEPTWEMGLQGCTNKNTHVPRQWSCWRGVINGQIISVAAGQQGNFGDPSQGLIMIFHGPSFSIDDPSTEVYSTPLRLGAMRIASVNGTLFTITAVDVATPGALLTPVSTLIPETTFTFDLDTRQWVSPSPEPSVTVTPVLTQPPLPTNTPILSPLPTP